MVGSLGGCSQFGHTLLTRQSYRLCKLQVCVHSGLDDKDARRAVRLAGN